VRPDQRDKHSRSAVLQVQINYPLSYQMSLADDPLSLGIERSGMQVVRAIGGRAPLHLTSVGKLFLAADDPLRVRSYATRTGLLGQTRNSITQLQVLERELSRVRQYGIARDNEELELGVRCIAAGIYDDQGKLLAGLSISAPADRLDEAWLGKLQTTAKDISSTLGYQGHL
jgi:DNA-binding IclR family transcriptional regulator